MRTIEFISQQSGRLDKLLTEQIQQSRNQIEQLIKEGFVRVNGNSIKKGGYRVKFGDKIEYLYR